MLLECCTSRQLDSLVSSTWDNLSIWLLSKQNHSSDINGKTYFEIAGLAPVNVHNFYEGLLEVRPHLPIPHTLINMINTQSQATNSFKLQIIVAASSHNSCWRWRWLFYTLWVTLIVAWHTAPNSGCTYKCAYSNLPKILGQNLKNRNPELFHISGSKRKQIHAIKSQCTHSREIANKNMSKTMPVSHPCTYKCVVANDMFYSLD